MQSIKKIKYTMDYMKGIEIDILGYVKTFVYLISAIFAGYTVADLDPDFLLQFTTLKYQLVIIFVVVAGSFNFTSHWRKNLPKIFIVTIVTTFLLRWLRRVQREKESKRSKYEHTHAHSHIQLPIPKQPPKPTILVDYI
jgi:hypothetical protein